MKKSYLYLVAAMAVASCANNDELAGTADSGLDNGTTAIAFNMQSAALTRADNPSNMSDATKLNNQFIVWGEKTNSSNGTETVFKNYKVTYDNTNHAAGTSISNPYTWEYVGNTAYADTYVSPAISPANQTIKYWDNNATQYVFTAISAKPSDIQGTDNNSSTTNLVNIAKKQGTNGAYEDGYTLTVKSGASTGDLYFSDKTTIKKSDNSTGSTGENAYNGYVKLTFRNFETKVRFGIYETVPGYKVAITGIKFNTGDNNPTEHKSDGTGDDGKKFGIDGNFITAGENTKYDVTYDSNGKAQVAVSTGTTASKAAYLQTAGTTWLSTSSTSPVSTTAATPTWDNATTSDSKTVGNYTAILPNPSNTTNLKLTVSYDLYNEDTNEKISVDYKTVEVPAEYCKWQSNYAYTYIFKISDASTGLTPITFDACVVTDEIGNAENITEVTMPSITTFGYDATTKKYITGKEEYEVGNDIYATVVETASAGSTTNSPVTLSAGDNGNIALYTVTTTDATNYPITEASVANAIANSTVTGKITYTKQTINTSGDNAPVIVSSVPNETGGTVSVSALKFKAANSATTFAIAYTKDSKTTYKIVKVVASTQSGN